MTTRKTRAATAKESGLKADSLVVSQLDSSAVSASKPKASTNKTKAKAKPKAKPKIKTDPNALPHGLGVTAPTSNALSKSDQDEAPATKKRTRTVKVKLDTSIKDEDGTAKATITSVGADKPAPKPSKPKKASKYGIEFGVSPFEGTERFENPTPEQCFEVHRLLTEFHGESKQPLDIPEPSRTVAGCGEVKWVLEAMGRTYISTHTTMANANKMIQGLLTHYTATGVAKQGGSVDWNRVREASHKELQDAIYGGGGHIQKSGILKKILDRVHEENTERRENLRLAIGKKKELDAADTVELTDDPLANYTKAAIMTRHATQILLEHDDILTLDYMHAMDTTTAFNTLVTYPGIGVKTAACVLLFCMQKPVFAVDTHVWRMSKWLGWVPGDTDRDKTFAHLDVKVPDQLKYALHQLFIAHGKDCKKCHAAGASKEDIAAGNVEDCVLEHLLDRNREKPAPKKKRKRGETVDEDDAIETSKEDDDKENRPAKKAKRAGKKAVKGNDDEDDENLPIQKKARAPRKTKVASNKTATDETPAKGRKSRQKVKVEPTTNSPARMTSQRKSTRRKSKADAEPALTPTQQQSDALDEAQELMAPGGVNSDNESELSEVPEVESGDDEDYVE